MAEKLDVAVREREGPGKMKFRACQPPKWRSRAGGEQGPVLGCLRPIAVRRDSHFRVFMQAAPAGRRAGYRVRAGLCPALQPTPGVTWAKSLPVFEAGLPHL